MGWAGGGARRAGTGVHCGGGHSGSSAAAAAEDAAGHGGDNAGARGKRAL